MERVVVSVSFTSEASEMSISVMLVEYRATASSSAAFLAAAAAAATVSAAATAAMYQMSLSLGETPGDRKT
jgi:hypothetical protein